MHGTARPFWAAVLHIVRDSGFQALQSQRLFLSLKYIPSYVKDWKGAGNSQKKKIIKKSLVLDMEVPSLRVKKSFRTQLFLSLSL